MLFVVFLVGVFKDVLGGVMLFLIVMIIILLGIIMLICLIILKDKLKFDGLMNNVFNVRIGWLILWILVVVFVWMIFLWIGLKVIYLDEMGGLLFLSLLLILVVVFLFVVLFLLLLMEYGLLEMLGFIFRLVMRFLFILLGCLMVDNLVLFIGDGIVGVLIISR